MVASSPSSAPSSSQISHPAVIAPSLSTSSGAKAPKATKKKTSSAVSAADATSVAPAASAVSNVASPLPTQDSSSPAPAAKPTYAAAAKGAMKTLSKQMLLEAPDPRAILLKKAVPEARLTLEVMRTTVEAPLSILAQGRPYLAWRSLLKMVTGKVPLLVTLIHPRRAEVYWDVTAPSTRVPLLKALDREGYLRKDDNSAGRVGWH